MKLLTANMLQSHIKNVKNGYPFNIEATEVKTVQVDYDPGFLKRMLGEGRVDYGVLKGHADVVAPEIQLPDAALVNDSMLEDEDFLRKLHRAMLEVVVVTGALICPETGRRFSIADQIPNLLLAEVRTYYCCCCCCCCYCCCGCMWSWLSLVDWCRTKSEREGWRTDKVRFPKRPAFISFDFLVSSCWSEFHDIGFLIVHIA
jgi:multifunctional methyltransferase subunit TRM112